MVDADSNETNASKNIPHFKTVTNRFEITEMPLLNRKASLSVLNNLEWHLLLY